MRRPDSTRRLALGRVGAGYSLESSLCSRKAFSRAEVRLVGAAAVADQPSRRGRGPGTYPGAVIEYCSGQYPRMRCTHGSGRGTLSFLLRAAVMWRWSARLTIQ